MHRKTAYICYFMGLFACGFETRGYAPHGSCATHHASPLACVLRRTAYRQKFPISFAQRACFLDFCRNTVSPPRQLSPHEITQTFATFCLCLTGCIFFCKWLLFEQQKSCPHKRTAHCIISDYARSTLPERRQRVQTFTRFTSPSTIARTVCTLGFHAALV